MKYKVTEYNSDFQEEQTGTCDLCYGTAWVENGSITVEDENGTETEIELTVWDWGDYDTIYIDNVVNFSLGCKKGMLSQSAKKQKLGIGCVT